MPLAILKNYERLYFTINTDLRFKMFLQVLAHNVCNLTQDINVVICSIGDKIIKLSILAKALCNNSVLKSSYSSHSMTTRHSDSMPLLHSGHIRSSSDWPI